MAMRLADTFLVYLRSCFAILFSGQTPHWSLPRSFWDSAASLHRPMRAFVIAFLDSYEVRIKVRRHTRGAGGRRHLRRNKRK